MFITALFIIARTSDPVERPRPGKRQRDGGICSWGKYQSILGLRLVVGHQMRRGGPGDRV